MKYITAVVSLLLVSCPLAAAQGFVPSEPPPLVRFTGALHPLEEKGHGGLLTLTVSIGEKRWLFRIANVEKLTGRDPSSLRLIQSLFPPRMRLTGPAELLDPLREPAIAGKPLVIEGHLYTGDHMFFITSVKGLGEDR